MKNYLIKPNWKMPSALLVSSWLSRAKIKTFLAVIVFGAAIFANSNLNAQQTIGTYHYCGEVDGNYVPTGSMVNSYWPYTWYIGGATVWYYSNAEMGNEAKYLKNMAMYLSDKTLNQAYPYKIYLKNVQSGQGSNAIMNANDFPNNSWPNEEQIKSMGFTLVHNGINLVDKLQAVQEWVEFEFDEPFSHDGGDLLLLMVCGIITNAPAQTANWNCYNVGSTYSTRYLYAYNATTNYGYYNSTYKPHMRFGLIQYPSNLSVLPGGDNSFKRGNLFNFANQAQDSITKKAITKFSFDVSKLPNDYPNLRATYAIVGPDPLTDTVYKMVNPVDGAKYIDFKVSDKDANGIINYEIQKAEGLIVWSSGTGADNKSIDLRGTTIKAGRYKAVLTLKAQSDDPLYAQPFTSENFFNIRTDNDVEVTTILSPDASKEYPFGASTGGLSISANISNSGYSQVDGFFVQSRVYSVDYDPITEVATPNTTVDELIPATPYLWKPVVGGAPLQTGESVLLDERYLGSFLPATSGWYALEIRVWNENPALIDEELSNNIYPRAGTFYLFRAQNEVEPELTEIVTPLQGASVNLGRMVHTVAKLSNKGLVDVSEKDSIYLKTTVEKDLGDGTYRVVWEHRYMVKQAGAGEGAVNVYCVDSLTDEQIGWVPDESGNFRLTTEIDWAKASSGSVFQSVTTNFVVQEGLKGTIKIGQAHKYKTIKQAVDDLFYFGVSAPVTFELTDAEYTERSSSAAYADAPALDFRTKIPGVVRRAGNTTVVNSIKFVPDFERSKTRGSIRINLESLTGVGMAFGTSDTSAVLSSMMNYIQYDKKRDWAKSDGHIIFDGGDKKSIRVTMKMLDKTGNRGDFRAPFYLFNAQNITVKNLIIEDGINQPRSYQYSLPGVSYSAAVMEWINDYEISVGVNGFANNRTYSAGVVMRSLLPIQKLFNANLMHLDTTISSNNIIQGNEITKFSYGVTSIGMHYLIAATPFVSDIRDTVYNFTLATLTANPQLIRLSTDTATVGTDTTVVTTFESKENTSARTKLYYKYYDITQNSNRRTFTVLLDSSDGGIRRVYNHNNLIDNNLIYDIGRAGIFLGYEENTTVSNNRIHGIIGQVKDKDGNSVDVDAAGILIGGRQNPIEADGFSAIGLSIFNNEISNIASAKEVNGIKYEQSLVWEAMSGLDTRFPDASTRSRVFSNIIWGLQPANRNVDRYGINFTVSGRSPLDAAYNSVLDNMYYATADISYYMDKMLVANNTIVLNEDNVGQSAGDYYGIKLQKISNSRVINNAIELADSTLSRAIQNKFASVIFYQGPPPSELNNLIDYNIYSRHSNANVDIYRYVNTDITGVIEDFGYAKEYSTLQQWQNWMKIDQYSMAKSFIEDLEFSDETYPKLRFRKNPVPINSPLEKNGMYLTDAALDIDGVARDKSDQKFDIGAQYVNGKKFISDIEVLNIYEPATYQAGLGPFKDSEYFMIDEKPITVRALIKNNGNNIAERRKITLNVYEEPQTVNNSNAAKHNANFETNYYNNETAHYQDNTEFTEIANSETAYFTAEATVTIASGEGQFVEFTMTNVPRTYFEVNQTLNYDVPIHFSRMASNVTPRYKFVVSAETVSDEDVTNNSVEKYARFFVKKSQKDMLISAYNTYNRINTTDNVSSTTVTNPDFVAGRLNLDSIIAGFRRIDLLQSEAGESPRYDFDVLDRKAWDFRNIDFTLYKTLILSDELKIDSIRWANNHYDFTQRNFQDKQFAADLKEFLANEKAQAKVNLVIASENFATDIYMNHSFLALNYQAKVDLLRDYFKIGVQIDSFVNQNSEIQTFYKTALYEIQTVVDPTSPVYDPQYISASVPISYSGKYSTGRSLATNSKIGIVRTGWENVTLTDEEPFGVVYKQLDNFNGFSIVGSIFDTIRTVSPSTPNGPNVSMVNVPDSRKIMSLANGMQRTNVITLGFDWRHFGDITSVLLSVNDFINKNGGITDPILAVDLYGFEAVPINNRVELSWNIANESKVEKFNVERANIIDNKTSKFDQIATVNTNESNKIVNNDNNYNSTDRNVAYSNTYAYRIKAIDFAGNSSYSENKIVKIEDANFTVDEIAPNPVRNSSKLQISNAIEQNIYISVFDLSGREIMVLADSHFATGNHQFEINASDLNPGTYTVVIKAGKNLITKEFTVVK